MKITRTRTLVAGAILSLSLAGGGVAAYATNKWPDNIRDQPDGKLTEPQQGRNIYECVRSEKHKPKEKRECDIDVDVAPRPK